MKRKPKILIFDIETSPNTGLFFDVWNGTNINFITKERSVLTIAYKWYGSAITKVISVGDNKVLYKKDPYYDKEVISKFLEVLEEADYLVAHYGLKFDVKFLAARCFINGLKPFPKVQTVDTCVLAKRHFKLNSNKLDHIAKLLGLEGKMPMNWSFWKGCTEGDRDSIETMAAYNKQDVVLLEQVFEKMLPYVDTVINLNHFEEHDGHVCPQCQSKELHKRGLYYTKLMKKQRYVCLKCNHWSITNMEKER